MRDRYGSNLGFLDLVLNLLLGVTSLFIIAFLLIKESDLESPVEQKAEFIVVLTWDEDSDWDVDLWVEGPNGVASFRSPDTGQMSLSRDDLGSRNDRFKNALGETEIVRINREVVDIRGFNAGEYIVNSHYYFCKDNYSPVETSVEVVKLNPYQVIYKGKHVLQKRGDEHTYVRFKINQEGLIESVSHLPKTLVYNSSSLNDWGALDSNPFSNGGNYGSPSTYGITPPSGP
jgi:hypothetical protein